MSEADEAPKINARCPIVVADPTHLIVCIHSSARWPPPVKARRRPSGCSLTSLSPGTESGSGEAAPPSKGTAPEPRLPPVEWNR